MIAYPRRDFRRCFLACQWFPLCRGFCLIDDRRWYECAYEWHIMSYARSVQCQRRGQAIVLHAGRWFACIPHGQGELWWQLFLTNRWRVFIYKSITISARLLRTYETSARRRSWWVPCDRTLAFMWLQNVLCSRRLLAEQLPRLRTFYVHEDPWGCMSGYFKIWIFHLKYMQMILKCCFFTKKYV